MNYRISKSECCPAVQPQSKGFSTSWAANFALEFIRYAYLGSEAQWLAEAKNRNVLGEPDLVVV